MKYGEEMEFAVSGFILSILLFLLMMAAVEVTLDFSFDELRHVFLFIYKVFCMWSFPYVFSVIDHLNEDTDFILRGTLPPTYFPFSPIIYLWIKNCRT